VVLAGVAEIQLSPVLVIIEILQKIIHLESVNCRGISRQSIEDGGLGERIVLTLKVYVAI